MAEMVRTGGGGRGVSRRPRTRTVPVETAQAAAPPRETALAVETVPETPEAPVAEIRVVALAETFGNEVSIEALPARNERPLLPDGSPDPRGVLVERADHQTMWVDDLRPHDDGHRGLHPLTPVILGVLAVLLVAGAVFGLARLIIVIAGAGA